MLDVRETSHRFVMFVLPVVVRLRFLILGTKRRTLVMATKKKKGAKKQGMSRQDYLAAQRAAANQQVEETSAGGGGFRRLKDGDQLAVRLYGGSMKGYDAGNPNTTWCIENAQHWFEKKPFPCRKFTINPKTNKPYGLDCPLCELASLASSAVSSMRGGPQKKALKKFADDLYVNKKFIIPCTITNEEKNREKITLLEVTPKVVTYITKLLDADSSLGIKAAELFDLVEGEVVVVQRTGSDMLSTKYDVRTAPAQPVHPSGDEDSYLS